MGAYGLTLSTWDGHDIQGADYVSYFAEGGELRNTLRGQVVEVSIAGSTPKHVRVQPDGKDFDVEIEMTSDQFTQARLDELKSWFNPKQKGERYLAGTDGDSVERRASCVVIQFEVKIIDGNEAVQIFVAHMRNASGIWEAVDADSDSQDVDAGTPGSETWSLTDKGSTPAPLAVTLTAGEAKNEDDSWPVRRRIAFANRSEEPLGDRDVYAVKLCNLDDLSIAQIGGTDDHIRVMFYGTFLDRWIVDANRNVWVNYRWNARKVATLAANINDSVDELLVSNADGFARDVWPKSQGFFYLDDEAIFYSGERATYRLSGLIRSVLGTAAASHTAGATLYWIEHPYINLVYGYTAATDPEPPDDRKPLLDMENSANDEHVYGADGLTARGTRRSMQFAMRSSDTGVGAQHTRQFGDAPDQVWENDLPEAGKPTLNEMSRLFPVPLAGPVELDIEVGLPMRLQGLVEDSEGYETRLLSQRYTPTPLVGESFSLPGNVRKLRLVGSVGVVVGEFASLDAGASWDPPDTAGTADASAPEIELLEQYQATAVQFTLQQVTKITGLIVPIAKAMGATGDLQLYIMEDAGGKPAVDIERFGDPVTVTATIPHIKGTVPVANADIPVLVVTPELQFFSMTPVTLPAGVYWLSFFREAGVGSGLFYVGVGENGFLSYAAGSLKTPDNAICFGIVSDETEPQDDAPLGGGEVIRAANGVFPLDSTRAPKIGIGAEEDFYLLGNDGVATLSNAAGDYVSLRFPMKLDTALSLHTGTRRIIDEEFGIDVPWARQASSDDWPQAAPVDEELSWSETGALITVATERRASYL